MSVLRLVLAGTAFAFSAWADGAIVQAPSYATTGIVNAASYTADALAPNTIASIFGTNLSFNTKSLGAQDLVGGEMPTSLGGVTVYISGVAAGIYYVSPTQINFLIPSALIPGVTKLAVVRESVAGPYVAITLQETGPAVFQDATHQIIATHLDGSLVDRVAPATAGEWIVLYAEGLGRTVPDAESYALDTGIAPLQDRGDFAVLVSGVAVPPPSIYYAGLTPGYAGLYQVNVQLPETPGTNPEIRLQTGNTLSAPKTWLAVK